MIYNIDYFCNKVLKVESLTEVLEKVNRDEAYNIFSLKVNRKEREIMGIKKWSFLYFLQKNLLDNFLNDIPLPDNACGFVKGKSYLDFLSSHCGKKYYLRLDIENFFGSIKVKIINEVLKEYIKTPDVITNDRILSIISYITTYNEKLPQGAVTSPQISNIIFRRLDIRIRNYCRKYNIEYTRYADDILFSGDTDFLHRDSFYKMIRKIIGNLGLRINKKKILQAKDRLIINGYIVSDKISLSRKKIREINMYIYAFENYNGKKINPRNFQEFKTRLLLNSGSQGNYIKDINWISTIHYLSGWRSYLINFSKEKYQSGCKDYSRKILKIEKMLDILVDFKK